MAPYEALIRPVKRIRKNGQNKGILCREKDLPSESELIQNSLTEINKYKPSDLSCLSRGNPITEQLLNDYAAHIIDSNSSSILYIPTNLYRCFFENKINEFQFSNLINHLAGNSAAAKEFLLIGIPATPTSNNYMLGIIMLNKKIITILDPIYDYPGIDQRHFTYLLRVTKIVMQIAGLMFNLPDWELFLPTKYPRTSSQDSGIFFSFYVNQFVLQYPLNENVNCSVPDWRVRIHDALSTKTVQTKGDVESCAQKLSQDYIKHTIESCSKSFAGLNVKIKVRSFSEILQDFAFIGSCPDSFCRYELTQDLQRVISCVSCRTIYHYDCVSEYLKDGERFFCKYCCPD